MKLMQLALLVTWHLATASTFAASESSNTASEHTQSSSPEEATVLARSLLFGGLAKRDAKRAITLLRSASALHYGPAEFVLGGILADDPTNGANVKEGGDLLAQAAHDHCSGAAGLLGNMLYAASSKHPDVETVAINFLRAGAEGGDGLSQGMLAAIYQRGSQSLPKNLIAAYAWANLASRAHPHQSAIFTKMSTELKTRITAELSPEDQQSAENQAAELMKLYARETDFYCSQTGDLTLPLAADTHRNQL